MANKKKESQKEMTVEERLKALYQLQIVSSEIDRIRTIRGELPEEVQNLADELEGRNQRKDRIEEQIAQNKQNIETANESIRTAKKIIEKYNQNLSESSNGREFETISKELENLDLDIRKYEKTIREYQEDNQYKAEVLEHVVGEIEEIKAVYEIKKNELNTIVAETETEEKELANKAKELAEMIDKRLLDAFKRTRKSSHNGLAVAPIERDACSGCFNVIPPQRIIDVRSHKKITVCEYCGRVLIDEEFAQEIDNELNLANKD